ncbi:hypothetical protein HMPREF9370_0670 [Neisseria wadsworthii 9715]|uniref:Uncharacterized protein n=1 Tax=Neisseria wadsworthii 9715 TaxID=1030841 RepID=G4CNL1_9NEIS|nr:hypothetical protein HMPREF9370_0670 [Neisseria wadsworthii 9715]
MENGKCLSENGFRQAFPIFRLLAALFESSPNMTMLNQNQAV